MIHMDLFSGIGGFALAVDAVWENVEHIFCEIDPYCQALLKKRFEGSKIYGDIRTLSRERLIADTNSRGQAEQELKTTGDKQCDRECFILTGGFPCQPFSQAGKRKGTDDNRYLWPQMLRVIQDFKPAWVIAENVRGLLTINEGMVFEQVCLDLEGEGYEVQPFIIPACAVNAPHRRDRVWIVANRTGERPNTGKCDRQERYIQNDKRTTEEGKSERKGRKRRIGEIGADASDASNSRLQGSERKRTYEKIKTTYGPISKCGETWNQNWLEVATSLCRVDDGFSAELDGLKLSKSRHRVERLKALGNAIVSQIAIEIMKAIRNAGWMKEEHGA